MVLLPVFLLFLNYCRLDNGYVSWKLVLHSLNRILYISLFCDEILHHGSFFLYSQIAALYMLLEICKCVGSFILTGLLNDASSELRS